MGRTMVANNAKGRSLLRPKLPSKHPQSCPFLVAHLTDEVMCGARRRWG